MKKLRKKALLWMYERGPISGPVGAALARRDFSRRFKIYCAYYPDRAAVFDLWRAFKANPERALTPVEIVALMPEGFITPASALFGLNLLADAGLVKQNRQGPGRPKLSAEGRGWKLTEEGKNVPIED